VLRTDAALTTGGTISLALDVEWLGRLGTGVGRTDEAANPVSGGVLLTVLGAMGTPVMGDWRAGRRIRAPAELRRVARYLDAGVPDQERAFARRGVSLVGTVKSAALVAVVSHGSAIDELAASIRAFARRALADSVAVWSPRSAAIVSAIVIGDRTGLDNEVELRLQESGTYHVIAISGGNIALLAALTLAIFRMVGALGRTAMLTAASGLAAYGFVVRGGASVDRAVLMAVVYFAARAWDLRGPPFQSLALAAAVLVLADPLIVSDAGTLLTFGATVAIVAAAPLVPLASVPRMLVAPVTLLVASLAAELALLPVVATLFSRVTFAGLLLNFGAIPLMGVAQLAGMVVVPLYVVTPELARIAGWCAHLGAEGLVRTAELVRFAPWSSWRVAPPATIAVVAYYGAAIAAWVAWRQSWAAASIPIATREAIDARRSWQRAGVRVPLIAWALAATWIVSCPESLLERGDSRLHVTFFDVGQGDSALVRFPRGASLLVDTGGLTGSSSFDVGDRVVGTSLRHIGVRRLGTLALTHGDADHIGGAASVLREFRPIDVWDGVPVPPLAPLQQLHDAATAAGARWTTVQRADRTEIDGVQVIVHHPAIPDWERQDVRNDDSVVIELRWGEVSVVLTGDIGKDAESEIAARFEPAALRVVKVPHHGSNTSSSGMFLQALQPDVAVISVGRSNNYGHPAPAVLQRYADAGTAIFRTDRDGAVTVETDGQVVNVSTFTGRLQRFSWPQRHREHRAIGS
jgi:competence protein ComEC